MTSALTTTVHGLRKSHVKALVAKAKELGFTARQMPYMVHRCAQPGLANFCITWASFGGRLEDKLVAMKQMKEAMQDARKNFFEVGE